VRAICPLHLRPATDLLSSKPAANPRTLWTSFTLDHIHINTHVCAHVCAQRRVSKPSKASKVSKVRGFAGGCQIQTVESVKSSEHENQRHRSAAPRHAPPTARPIAAPRHAPPTARPPVKGTTKQQGRKGNSNRVFSVAANFSTYLTQHLTGQHQHDTA
jgi:hypothetical protein